MYQLKAAGMPDRDPAGTKGDLYCGATLTMVLPHRKLMLLWTLFSLPGHFVVALKSNTLPDNFRRDTSPVDTQIDAIIIIINKRGRKKFGRALMLMLLKKNTETEQNPC